MFLKNTLKTTKMSSHRVAAIIYVCNSLVDLFQEQLVDGGYPNTQHPRGVIMNHLLKVQKLKTAEVDHFDRAERTLKNMAVTRRLPRFRIY